MLQNLVNEGYSCDVFYLPGVSNSKEKIFQTYIGPFNKLEEANQYLNSSEGVQNSGKIITRIMGEKVKNKFLVPDTD